MSELIVFGFRDEYRAPEVLNELRRRDWDWVQHLDDAVAVTLDKDGKAKVQFSVDLSTSDGVASARMWGSFLSAALFLPLAGVMVEAADGITLSSRMLEDDAPEPRGRVVGNGGWEAWFQLSEVFMRDIAAVVRPGSSAIFMLLQTQNLPGVLGQLHNYGNTLLHTSLNSEQEERMRRCRPPITRSI